MSVSKTRSLNISKTVKDLSIATSSLGKYSAALDSTTNSADKATKSINKLTGAASLFSLKTLTKGVSKLISTFGKFSQSSVDYIEDLNLLKVAFGETADQAFALTKSIASVTGFDEATLTRNLGTFRNLTSTLGAANEVADLLATNLEKMSLDISSLYNVDLDRAAYALTGMLTGQPRTIKTLTGANITQSALQEDLTALGINRTVRELNKAEKAILSYISLEKQLMQSNGDLARTIEQPAQLLRVFREQISKAGRSIGGLLIPVIQSVIPYLTAFLMVFNEIVGTLLTFLGIDADSFWADMTSGAKAAAGGIGAVTKAADKAQRGLRNFDKLNVITTPTSSGGSGGTGAGGNLGIDSRILDALKEYNLHLDNIKTKATTIRDRIMEWLGFSKILNENGELIGWKYEGIDKTLKNIYNSLKKTNGIVKLLIGYGIYKLLTKLLSPMSKVFKYLTDLVKLKLVTLFSSIKKIGFEPTLDFLVKSMTPLERISVAIGGIVAMTTGVLSITSAIEKMATDGINASNAFEILLGFIELVGGAIITVTAITGTFSTTLALATGGISLLVGAGAALIAYFNANKEEVNEATKSTRLYREELAELENQIANKMTETYAQAARADDLKQKLADLVDENGRVRGSHEKVEAILKELNTIMGTNYKLTGDQITLDGKLINGKKQLTDSVQEYINKLKAEMIVEASRDKIQKIYERNLELKGKENELLEKLKESAKNYNLETEEGAKQFYEDNQSIISQLKTLQGELKTNSDQLDIYAQAAIEAEKGHYEAAEKLMLSTAEKAKISITDIYGQLTDVFNKNITTEIDVKLELDAKEFKKDLDKYTKEANKGLLNAQLYTSNGGKIAFASGGFPEDGLFFANHNEMVGKFINGKTAVANNDQIVAGISQGVREAIISTGGLNNRPVIIKAEGDANGLMSFIKLKQQEDDMQYGY